MPSAGGTASLVVDSVHDGLWAVTDVGIYFIDPSRRVCRIEDGGKIVCVGTIDREGPDAGGVGVSRNGKEIVFVQPEPARSDLRMAEGRLFR